MEALGQVLGIPNVGHEDEAACAVGTFVEDVGALCAKGLFGGLVKNIVKNPLESLITIGAFAGGLAVLGLVASPLIAAGVGVAAGIDPLRRVFDLDRRFRGSGEHAAGGSAADHAPLQGLFAELIRAGSSDPAASPGSRGEKRRRSHADGRRFLLLVRRTKYADSVDFARRL